MLNIIKNNFLGIKEVFISLVANGDRFPRIGLKSIFDFCRLTEITDDITNSTAIELAFAAVNYTEGE